MDERIMAKVAISVYWLLLTLMGVGVTSIAYYLSNHTWESVNPAGFAPLCMGGLIAIWLLFDDFHEKLKGLEDG